jgi:ectoine hydroxylase-related dioxygenase (phytanoyl-CoA dioxygenase family)
MNSLNDVFDELGYEITEEDRKAVEFYHKNGYCIIKKSKIVSEHLSEFKKIIDDLIAKESWRGGWEGKEEYMKYKKIFQPGAHRLGNLFNKNKLFLKLLIEENILKIASILMENDVRIGGLDMREPLKGKGLQEFHIDWIPKKENNQKIQNIVAMIYLDDSTKDNGALRLVPESHKIPGWIQDNFDVSSSHQNEKIIEVKESTIILFDGNLWHSGTTNNNGNRRRALYIDIRHSEIPPLLNQRIYLDENTQNDLDEVEKFLLGINDNEKFLERVHTAGDVFRKEFKTDTFMKQQK